MRAITTILAAFVLAACRGTAGTPDASFEQPREALKASAPAQWYFAGVGEPGATCAEGACRFVGSSLVLEGAKGTLQGVQRSTGAIGWSAPLSPNGHKIYLVTPASTPAHRFSGPPGWPFIVNAPVPIVVNINGVATPMDLYESTNLLFASFTPTVQS